VNSTSEFNINKGLYLSKLGKNQEALTHYNKGLPHLEKKKTYPKLFSAYVSLAYLYLNENNTNEAGAFVRKAETTLGNLEQINSRQSFELLKGKYLTAIGKLKEGEAVLKNLQLEVENGDNNRRLTIIYSALQDNLKNKTNGRLRFNMLKNID
jgi:tetratricopeptide (TPR) repeat protein